MSIKTRRFLFYSLVCIFILLGTFLVLNSRGYRLDFKNFQLEATGGIYLSSTPTKTLIELDGEKIKNEAGLLQQGTLIDNLLPGEYVLSVQLDNHSSWKSSIEVESGTVSVFDSIILVPEIEPLQISDSLADRIVASGEHLGVEAGGGVSINGTLVYGHEIVALSDSGTILTRSTVTSNYYLANAFKPDENLNLSLIFNNLKSEKLGLPGAIDIKEVTFYPYNDQRFIASTQQAIYIFDINRLTIEQIALGVSDFFVQGQNSVAWIEDNQLKTFNLPLRTTTVALDLASQGITDISLEQLHDTSLGWFALNKAGDLSLWTQSNAPEVIDTNVKTFALSPNEENIAVLKNDGTLYAYNFEEEERTSIDSSTSINEMVWFNDSMHLFILKGNSLIFDDISSANLENGITIGADIKSFSYTGDDTIIFSNQSGVWERILID